MMFCRSAIIQRLNEEADTARRYLDLCELEVLGGLEVDVHRQHL